jgi:hypothetical protein
MMSESIAAQLQAKRNRANDLRMLAQGYTHLQVLWYRDPDKSEFSLACYSKVELSLPQIWALALRERPSASKLIKWRQSELANPQRFHEFVPG